MEFWEKYSVVIYVSWKPVKECNYKIMIVCLKYLKKIRVGGKQRV